MKILYISQYFPPEMGAPAARADELSRHWAAAGHEVTVLTGFPNHPTGKVPPEYRKKILRLVGRENIAGVEVIRTWLWPLPNRKAHERILNYSSFCLSASTTGLFLDRPDIVIASSPQLLVGVAGWWIARWKRVPLVFEVRDLWPESLAAVGVGDERSLLNRSLSRVAGFLYDKAERIIVVTPAFKNHLVKHWQLPAEKVSIVENGVETDLFRPSVANIELRKELGAEGRFLVCYIGTLGMAQGLEMLVQTAARLQVSLPQVLFVLVGEGAEKEKLIALARARRLTNLRFVDQQARERIPIYVNAADACLVLLKKNDVFKTVIPTKMLEYMACARPVILGVDGQAHQILDTAQAGLYVAPENASDLVRAIARMAADASLRETFGRNGRRYVLEHFSRRRTAEVYVELLESMLREGWQPSLAA